MKKTMAIAAAAASVLVLAACVPEDAKAEGMGIPLVEFSPFVGAEREVKSDTSIAYAGITAGDDNVEVVASLDLDLKDGTRGDVTNVNLDASFAVTDGLSIYGESDFNENLDNTETKVGVLYTF